jgi:ElaB/YqjD/DUF883 family membrane-anchored ribosome-binding protein
MKNRIQEHAEAAFGKLAHDGQELAEQTLAQVKSKLSGALESESFAGAAKAVEDYVAKRPAVCLGVAITVGVLVGWFIKRR